MKNTAITFALSDSRCERHRSRHECAEETAYYIKKLNAEFLRIVEGREEELESEDLSEEETENMEPELESAEGSKAEG